MLLCLCCVDLVYWSHYDTRLACARIWELQLLLECDEYYSLMIKKIELPESHMCLDFCYAISWFLLHACFQSGTYHIGNIVFKSADIKIVSPFFPNSPRRPQCFCVTLLCNEVTPSSVYVTLSCFCVILCVFLSPCSVFCNSVVLLCDLVAVLCPPPVHFSHPVM